MSAPATKALSPRAGDDEARAQLAAAGRAARDSISRNVRVVERVERLGPVDGEGREGSLGYSSRMFS